MAGGLLRDAHQPERCAPWRMAEVFGAQCELSFDLSRVTHVVSGQAESASVKKALANGIHAVSLQWLLDSAARWQRQAETPYSLAPGAVEAIAGGLAGGVTGAAGGALARSPTSPPTSRAVRAAATFARELLGAQYTASQRLSASILYLVPAESKQNVRGELRSSPTHLSHEAGPNLKKRGTPR